MARINHGPLRRRRCRREACLLIKQRPTYPVKVLMPLSTIPTPAWELHKMLDTRALFFVNFQIVFPYFVGLVFPLSIGLCLWHWHWLSFFFVLFSAFFCTQVAACSVIFASRSAKLPKLFNWLTFVVFARVLWQIWHSRSEAHKATANQSSGRYEGGIP